MAVVLAKVTRIGAVPLLTLAVWAAWATTMAAGATLVPPAEAAATAPVTLPWADATSSPHPAPSLEPRDARLLGLCASGDRALHEVAGRIVRGELGELDTEALTDALRRAGSPHVWPRAFTYRARSIDRTDAGARLKSWLRASRTTGEQRCGVASKRGGDGDEVIAVVAVEAQADLRAVPIVARTGAWIRVDANALVEASGAKVVVLGPEGLPRGVPTSFADGRIQATFSADKPGRWLAQVLLDGQAGPRPVLEALVFAGTSLPAAPVAQAEEAPGERAGVNASGAGAALRAMVSAARQSEAIAALEGDVELDALANAHAQSMMRGSKVAHDLGEGDPRQRTAGLTVPAREIGENVAHARTVALAHRALWASPSHRENLLDARFRRLGVGVATGADGTVWVTELFASPAGQ